MKDPHQSPVGEVRPFLFCIGMCLVAFCFSVFVCASLFFALNFSNLGGSDTKVVKMTKMPAKQGLTYAVK